MSITIGDGITVEILAGDQESRLGLARYLRGPAARLLAGAEFAAQAGQALALVNPGEAGFRFEWAGDVPLGNEVTALQVSGGTAALLAVFNRAGMPLVDDAFIGPAIEVPEGRAFVSFLIRPTLTAGASASSGALSFGFDTATEVEWRFYQPFDLGGPPVTLGEACRSVLESMSIPGNVQELKAMAGRAVGTMAVVSGRGELQISCAANVAAAINPLASLETFGRVGTLSVSGAATASVGVSAALSGDFQVRVQTTGSGKVRLGYHKMAAREVGVTLQASAGPTVTFRDRELLELLFGRPTSPGEGIQESLTKAGVAPEQLERITAAMEAGLSRKLQLEIAAGFSSLAEDEAAFLYDVDLAALDDVGSQAIDKALSGDLRGLTRLEDELPAHGISIVQSRTARLRARKVKWRLNLVGLVNVLSVSTLAAKAAVFHDEESGELVMTDEATSQKVRAIGNRKDLQRLLYQSLMLTMVYKASGIDSNTGMTAAQSYFKIDKDVNRHEMADYLDAVAAVGLLRAADIEGWLGLSDDFDRGSVLIEAEYDQAACERMFIDEHGRARDRDYYEDVGKLALLALVQEDDADAYRRVPLTDASLWRRMRDSGPSDFRTLLPPKVTSGSPEAQRLYVAVVTADYTMIVWWAGAMAAAALKLHGMREFLAGPPAVVPSEDNQAFTERRRDLSKAMVDVIRKSPSTFGGDPWGLVALFYASKRSASVNAAIVSPKLALFLPPA